ncbi:CHAT domain-containing protein [Xanthobacter agilis]|uniref:Tetratricopeptide (TPR) repeat protein n=1 Tax=Xanthobacter agilis TaxID=47492 RepID=A0ABU0LIJ8_XANAG|nr:tetratricopeptide repeat protein [Xanthobacter agilis]MDQ0506927.1 tetratricopeptide (TPR) repeat protein [Xanthobacter agilis]
MSIDARAAFSRATELHRQGKLDEAIEIYRRLTKVKPVFEVQRLLVFALLQTRRFKDALLVARRTREAFPSLADAHVLLGAAYQASRTWDKALAAYEAAAVLDPALGEAHYLAGNVLVALGRDGDAVARFDRVLALDPRAAEALANRATALSRIGRSQDALRDCEALTAMQPWEPRHWLSMAGTLLELSRFEEATRAADEALHLAPHLADAHFLRGQSRLGLGDVAGARTAFAAALAAAPEQVGWAAHLARVLRLEHEAGEALAVCDAALARNPACAAVLHERAEARRAAGDLSGALADAEAALALEPGFAPAHVTAALLKRDLGDAEGGARACAAALAADPAFPLAAYVSGTEHLAHGRWAEGWAGYEARARMMPPAYLPLPFQRWDGQEPVEELIVLGEQGIGDLIQFGRLLRVLADRGMRACLLTRPRHVPLLSRIDARVPVIGDLEQVDRSRAGLRWVPLASLPGLLTPEPTAWPGAPYLTAAPERVARWRPWRLAEPAPDPMLPPDPELSLAGEADPAAPLGLPGELQPTEALSGVLEDAPPAPIAPPVAPRKPPLLRIGINWQGDPSPSVDVGRSVPLAAFAPLAELEDVELVSLQWGYGEEQIDDVPFSARIVRLAADRDADGTFVDTAGVLQHLDLVVTVDSSLVHLAGARGRTAFLALRAVPDWRWGREGERTALYPSVRLFRQREAGDWDEVFQRITQAVAAQLRANKDAS